jgi:predicted GNAT family acetyltransferase
MTNAVQQNTGAKRFELPLDGGKSAIINYVESGSGVLDLTHTEVPPGFEGQGIGAKLVTGALEIAKSNGNKVIPSCPYVAKFIERHEEFKPLLASS